MNYKLQIHFQEAYHIGFTCQQWVF